jgi:2-C-methyl-D-erythritol 4-phosphate cytidylyltransferase
MARHFALIPAAGGGSRMGTAMPKQYLELAGRPMLYHSLRTFHDCEEIAHAYVVLEPNDSYWENHDWSEFRGFLTVLRCGGETRAQSVLNGLNATAGVVSKEEWVLVHDAARPCLTQALLEKLVAEAGEDKVGGILAVPLADTLKRADADRRIAVTLPREDLWKAQTPQMFRHGMLRNALEAAGDEVTDEASAIEGLGERPLLVNSDSGNFKVTYPPDLQLAALILEKRRE